jgi:clathrin heavy chain
VNEALNDLYIEEEDYESLRHSVDNFSNFNALALAKKIRSHELLEFRRIAAYLYKVNGKFTDSVQLSKQDGILFFLFFIFISIISMKLMN